jgi:hypothetical protein
MRSYFVPSFDSMLKQKIRSYMRRLGRFIAHWGACRTRVKRWAGRDLTKKVENEIEGTEIQHFSGAWIAVDTGCVEAGSVAAGVVLLPSAATLAKKMKIPRIPFAVMSSKVERFPCGRLNESAVGWREMRRSDDSAGRVAGECVSR